MINLNFNNRELKQKTFKEQFDILNLPGRCSTGSERGRGCLWHAVPIEYHSGLCPKTNSETVLIGQLGVLPNKVNTSLKLVKYSI